MSLLGVGQGRRRPRGGWAKTARAVRARRVPSSVSNSSVWVLSLFKNGIKKLVIKNNRQRPRRKTNLSAPRRLYCNFELLTKTPEQESVTWEGD